MNIAQPFEIGQPVITIKDFTKLKKVWGYNYPKKDSVVSVKNIRKHPIHDFWLISIDGCECELCHNCFAPIQSQFQPIALTKVIEQEVSLICAN